MNDEFMLKKQRTKLLFVTVIPSPYQRQLFARLAAEKNIDVEVWYYAVSARDRQWAPVKLCPYEEVLSGCTLSILGRSAHWNADIAKRLRETDADLVVVSDYSAPTAQIAMRSLTRMGKPWIFWGEIPGFAARGAFGVWVRGRLQAGLRGASAIAGVGSGAVDAYERLFPGKHVFNIPYFCDLAPYVAARKNASPDTRGTVDVLFSGQLIERKGVDVLLQAFTMIAAEQPRLRLMLLGSGPERARLEATVPDNVKHRVVFLGHREPDELPAVFARADAFCLPSRHDGWGIVVNEALGAGLPIVVSDAVRAGDDLVRHGENGFVVPAADACALAAVLGKLASDDGLRERFAEASRHAARLWGVGEGVLRWRAAIEAVVRARQTAV